MSAENAIGIFDSGIGGLTVMKEIMRKSPQESLIYFGDSARLPYGDKSPETILRYSIENSEFLLNMHIKLLVIACNTASAFATYRLKKMFKVPIIDVITAGSDHIVQETRNQKIGVIATRATTNSKVYLSEIKKRLPNAEVFSIACPLLVPLIEEHFFDHLATKLILKDYLQPLKEKKVDTLLLGCTHYPLLKSMIEEEMGPSVKVIDSAYFCAQIVADTLERESLRSDLTVKPTHCFYTSDDPEKFHKHGVKFLDHPIEQVFLKKI